ncbi:DUF3696 domain-containing protein [Thioflexithrix psekupsensis]|uniref:DUF3696 domain-containing protein n=1 Tax=Thioflexithrix psekupsensis TaxID=1570016 RepID=A0A251X396_9GAMM|nr:DUF3696 domain-containing protein [Thioflexithrix psekupsensis]OUD11648.1 hypothetical protein TPSD3_16460 [Thioflexithrix psekupsensis]
MITNIRILNFKSFREISISPRPLNIFTGLNGMGKSSVLQTLLLLRQSYRQNTLLQNGLLLNGDYIEIGKGKDAYCMYGSGDNIISFELQWNEQLDFHIEFKYEDKDKFGLLPLHNKKEYEDEIWKQALFCDNFQYLAAERASPKTFFPASDYHVDQVHTLGNYGQFTTHFIARNRFKAIPTNSLHHPKAISNVLLAQLDAWLGEISPNVQIGALLDDELAVAKLSYKFQVANTLTDEIRPTNVGFGITYVLPIITAVLSSKPGDLLILENPESHLHPKGQSQLGRLFALAAQAGVQLFIETHSDHILNGIRIAVREKDISPDNVVSFHFKRDEEGYSSHVTPIMIDEKGKLYRKMEDGSAGKIPKGFFDEWTNSMMKLF